MSVDTVESPRQQNLTPKVVRAVKYPRRANTDSKRNVLENPRK